MTYKQNQKMNQSQKRKYNDQSIEISGLRDFNKTQEMQICDELLFTNLDLHICRSCFMISDNDTNTCSECLAYTCYNCFFHQKRNTCMSTLTIRSLIDKQNGNYYSIRKCSWRCTFICDRCLTTNTNSKQFYINRLQCKLYCCSCYNFLTTINNIASNEWETPLCD